MAQEFLWEGNVLISGKGTSESAEKYKQNYQKFHCLNNLLKCQVWMKIQNLKKIKAYMYIAISCKI